MNNRKVRKDVIDKLHATGDLGKTKSTAEIAERAGYKCEYCDLDLLESVASYKLFEIDHIIPKSKIEGDPDELTNLVLSCRICNVNLKRAWDPRTVAGNNATRADLVNARAARFAAASTLRAAATARTFREADQGLFEWLQIRAPAGGHGPEK